MKSLYLISAFLTVTLANEIEIYNGCPFTIWPAILGNPGKGEPHGGGFALGSYQAVNLTVAKDWAGRVWARTKCGSNGNCETGDCGNRISCNGAGGRPPVSVAEITLSGWGGVDYYAISLVDGYNLPMRMQPRNNFVNTDNGAYDCKPAGCIADLNAKCPAELSTKNSDGWTVSCMTACMKFNTDQYCCQGVHSAPWKCESNKWPKDYPAIFKSACPSAFTYSHDSSVRTFTCKGSPEASYVVTFCPSVP